MSFADNHQWPVANNQTSGVRFAGSTPWSHVPCAQGWKIPDPVMGFYTRLPSHVPCKWSTNHGQLGKHIISHPLPERQLEHWNDVKLREQAAHFRQKFSQDMAGLTKPLRFEDLYEYFDGRDLYFQGAWNLWNLVNMLVDENIYMGPAVLDAQRKETDAWVNGWAVTSVNRQRLLAWNRVVDILTVLSPEDWDRHIGGVSDLNDAQQGMLRVSLVNLYRCLIEPGYAGSPPFHARRESRNGEAMSTWLGELQSSKTRHGTSLLT